MLMGVWSDFRDDWPRLVAVDALYKLLAVILLTPASGVLVRGFVAMGGDDVVSDHDIVTFVLSPIGAVGLVAVAAFALAAAALGLCCLMTLSVGRARNETTKILDALDYVMRRAASIWQLMALVVARTLLLAAPFLAVGAIVGLALVSDYDINYYLTHRPPSFLVALAAGAALVVGASVVIGSKLAGWLYALPILLFENTSSTGALAASTERARGHKKVLIAALAGWLSFSVALSAAATALVAVLGRLTLGFAERSLVVTALVAGVVVVVWAVVGLGVSFVQSSTLALVSMRLYRELGGGGTLPKIPSARISFPLANARTPWVAIVLVLVALGAGAVGYLLVDSVRATDDILVTAHRGASGRAPENTLAAIRSAIEDGADFVEIDVQETADGVVVVIHDSDFMRIASDRLKIWDAGFEEARALDIGSWFSAEFGAERIPTLEEVLALCKGRVRVDIELKYYGHDQRLEERVVEIVEKADMANEIVIMSLNRVGLRKIRDLRPDWTVGFLTATSLGDLTRLDADFLAVHSAHATPGFIRRAHAAGMEVWAWTVNDPVHLSRLMSSGVDSVITDEPALARHVLRVRAEMSSVERLLVELSFWLGVEPKEPSPETDLGG